MNFLKAKSFKLKAGSASGRAGIAVLPTIIIVAAIIMELAIAAVLISNIFTGSAFNTRLGNEALALAEAGAEDGILKVIRYCPIGEIKNMPFSECVGKRPQGAHIDYCDEITGKNELDNEVPHEILVGTRTVCVLIKDDDADVVGGDKIIISGASISGRVKRVEVKLAIDQTTGQTEASSFKECYNYTISSQTCF